MFLKAFVNQNCKQRQAVQLYKDTQKLLNEFEMRYQSTQCGPTLGVFLYVQCRGNLVFVKFALCFVYRFILKQENSCQYLNYGGVAVVLSR